MVKKYYKCVWKNKSNELESVCRNTDIVDSEIKVFYKIGEWVKARLEGSKLFVFDSLKAANDFRYYEMSGQSQIEVYECKVQNPVDISGTRLPGNYRTRQFWQKYLSFRKKHRRVDWKELPQVYGGSGWPNGTIAVSAVKLVKKVV